MTDEYKQDVYFIGISLPKDLDHAVSRLQWHVHETDKHTLRPLLPHVTLLHPPSLRGIMPDELIPRVHEVAARYLPFSITCDEIGSFGSRVIFIRCHSLKLVAMQAELVRLLPPEARELHYRRPYTPHITLAQAYEPHEIDVEQLQSQFVSLLKLPREFTVDSISYFQRILPRQYRSRGI